MQGLVSRICGSGGAIFGGWEISHSDTQPLNLSYTPNFTIMSELKVGAIVYRYIFIFRIHMSVHYCHYHQDEEQEQCDPKRSFAHYPLSPPHSIAVTLANSHTAADYDDD